MTGKQLKNSILQWAIQGKLVSQDPNDESASVLLEKIRAEKARLMKDGKIKKDKKESIIYRGDDNSYYEKFADGKVVCIDDEIPFEIPSSWEWCRVCNVFETSSGTTPQSKNPLYYSNGTINWVRTTDLNNGVLSSCEVKITPKAKTDYNLSIIPQNSICIAMYGGGGTIGKHSIIHFDTTINQSVCAIHPNEKCNMEFVHIFMQFQRPFWMDHAAGSRKDPNINQIIIKNCLIPFPPKNEQDKIVEKYNSLLPLLDYYSTIHQQKERLSEEIIPFLKKSILQEAIQGKLVPQDASEEPASILLQRIKEDKQRLVREGKLKKKDIIDSTIFRGDDNKYYEQIGKHCIDITDSIPFDLPANWSWCRIENYVKLVTDFVASGSFASLRENVKYYKTPNYAILVKAQDFQYDFQKDLTYTDKHGYDFLSGSNLFGGELILSNVGSIGKVFIVPKLDVKMSLAPNSIMVKPIYENQIKWLYYLFNSEFGVQLLYSISSATAIRKFNKTSFKKLIIPIPPTKEQERIVKKIETMFDRIKGN